jgi:hypothetical protein
VARPERPGLDRPGERASEGAVGAERGEQGEHVRPVEGTEPVERTPELGDLSGPLGPSEALGDRARGNPALAETLARLLPRVERAGELLEAHV